MEADQTSRGRAARIDFENDPPSTLDLRRPCSFALLNDFRTLDWAEEYKYPTVILSQMKQLLAEHQEG